MGVLEAKLFITAKDDTGEAFKSIEGRIARMARTIDQVDRLARAADSIGGSARLASDFERAERGVTQLAASLRSAEGAIGVMERGFDRVASHAQRAERHVSAMSRMMHGAGHLAREMAPLVVGGAGFGAVEAMKHVVEAGAELQHERVASANAGRTPAEVAAFEAAAKRTAIEVPTASYTESMKALLETTSAFGSVEHAIDHLTFMMKTAAVLKAASGGKITDSAGEMGQKFAKFFEMRGVANDPKRFEAEGNEMVRAMSFTGGTFNPHEMFNFASQAKSALRNFDVAYLSRVVPSLAGEIGGEKAGTAANAFYNVIMGKARDAKQAAEWMKYGLLDPKMTDAQKGKVISWRAGAVKNTDVALRNPLEWFEGTVLPAMQAKGVKINDTMELSKVLATMFRNSMSNQFANENAQLADRTRLHKDAGLIDKTESPASMYDRNLRDDPGQAVAALQASLNSLSSAVSVPAMKSAAGAITDVASALSKLSAAAMDHPIAAMTTAGVAGTAALGGSGLVLSGMMNGFGLKGSAVALNASAASLDAAAAKLAGGSALGEAGNVAKAGAGGLLAGLGFFGLGVGATVLGATAESTPGGDPTDAQRKAAKKAEDDYFKAHPSEPKSFMGWLARGYHAMFPPVSGFAISKYGSPAPPSSLAPEGAGVTGLHGGAAAKPFDPSQLSGKIDANVKPDQISAKVEGQVQGSVSIKVDASADLKATIAAAKGGSDKQFSMKVGAGGADTGPDGRKP